MTERLKNRLETLSEREQLVLSYVIQKYIQEGQPISSRSLTELPDLRVSSATVRNILSRLESMGLLTHPHTSAGRIPTEDGYRYYVDHLMMMEPPGRDVQMELETLVHQFARDLEMLIDRTSHFLGEMSTALVLISLPSYLGARVRDINLVELNQQRILIVVQMTSGPLKTAALQVDSRLSPRLLKEAETILRDLFVGRKLLEIDDSESEKLPQLPPEHQFVRQILDNAFQIFRSLTNTEYKYYGTHQLIQYPEFANAREIEPVLEAVEEGRVYQLLPTTHISGLPRIMIGGEIGLSALKHFSLVSRKYRNPFMEGSIHILGPTRMAYDKICGLVEYTADEVGKNIGVEILE
ncbi:MAG: heat-inducible transcriptional repressor HrcA [Lentisphaeria bacterium]|nr:heat-inducible transcriptional repressor HrcA [Candidatus Neomarinimicrobiota bacterium]MCF7842142.1 heat-inducible transcriptional repressor HrcA [Lentisphaeria bacterium]